MRVRVDPEIAGYGVKIREFPAPHPAKFVKELIIIRFIKGDIRGRVGALPPERKERKDVLSPLPIN